MTDLPDAALDAAAAACPFASRDMLRRALKAAAPHITAATVPARKTDVATAVTAAESTLRGFLGPWLTATAHGTTLESQVHAAAAIAVRDAAPHLTADPATENEGFRAYKAGLAAGRAEGAAAEQERFRQRITELYGKAAGSELYKDGWHAALINIADLLPEGDTT